MKEIVKSGSALVVVLFLSLSIYALGFPTDVPASEIGVGGFQIVSVAEKDQIEKEVAEAKPLFGSELAQSVLDEIAGIFGFVLTETIAVLIIMIAFWLTDEEALHFLFSKTVPRMVALVVKVSAYAITLVYLTSVTRGLIHYISGAAQEIL